MNEVMDALWNLLAGDGGSIATKVLLIYIIYVLKTYGNRIGEIEDKQDSMVAGFKKVPAINGNFTASYNETLDRLRESRDRRSKLK